MSRQATLVLIMLVLASGIAWWSLNRHENQSARDAPVIDRQVFWHLTARNTSSAALRDVEVLSFVPAGETWNQRLESLEMDYPFEIVANERQPFVRFSIDSIPPFGQRDIRINTNLDLVSKAPDSDHPKNPDLLDPEPLIESNHAEILSMATTLKRDSEFKSARAIHDWLVRTIKRSGYDAIDRGALHAFREKTGDCSEFAALAVALARAMELPARLVGGYLAPEDGRLSFDDYHAWAEVWVDGRWLIVDSQRQVFDATPAHYIATHQGLGSARELAWSRFFSTESSLKITME